MKIVKNILFQSFVATLLSTTALAQTGQQAVDSLDMGKVSKHKPSMVILTGDLLQGRIGPEAQRILEGVETISSGFSHNGFSVTQIGDGSERPVRYQAKLDSVLNVMDQEDAYRFVLHAHGAVENYMHVVEMGKPPGNAKGQDKSYMMYTGEVLEGVMNRSVDKQKPVRLPLLSCESDMFMLRLQNFIDYEGKTLPEASQFFTCSQGGDVAFGVPSEAIARNIQFFPNHPITDLMDYYHKYNASLYDDTDNKYKYKNTLSGGSLAIAERNEKGDIAVKVLCPRRSLKERLGTGISEADKAMIIENWMKYPFNPLDTPQAEDIEMIIENADESLRNAHHMKDMSILQQSGTLHVLSYLHQKYELEDQADFLIQECKENTPKPIVESRKDKPLFPPHIPH